MGFWQEGTPVEASLAGPTLEQLRAIVPWGEEGFDAAATLEAVEAWPAWCHARFKAGTGPGQAPEDWDTPADGSPVHSCETVLELSPICTASPSFQPSPERGPDTLAMLADSGSEPTPTLEVCLAVSPEVGKEELVSVPDGGQAVPASKALEEPGHPISDLGEDKLSEDELDAHYQKHAGKHIRALLQEVASLREEMKQLKESKCLEAGVPKEAQGPIAKADVPAIPSLKEKMCQEVMSFADRVRDDNCLSARDSFCYTARDSVASSEDDDLCTPRILPSTGKEEVCTQLEKVPENAISSFICTPPAPVVRAKSKGKRTTGATAGTGNFQRLVHMLAHGGSAEREAAVSVLRTLAGKSAANKAAIVEAGGIEPTVKLLRFGAPGAQEAAAHVLGKLASSSPRNRTAIVQAGGIEALVRLLDEGDSVAQGSAASALGNLAWEAGHKAAIADAGGIGPLVQLVDGAGGGTAAAALCNLACQDGANSARIVEAGGIPALVKLLTDGAPAARTRAAGALENLAHESMHNSAAIAEAGGIVPLVQLLTEGEPAAQGHAARALCNLAFRSAANKMAIAKAGGMSPLGQLLPAPSPREPGVPADALQHCSSWLQGTLGVARP